MNSLPDKRLEETIDQLLAASVSPGSEPEGFRVGAMPRLPEFQWMQLFYALTGVSILGGVFIQWLFSHNVSEIDFTHLFSVDKVSSLFLGISPGTLATILGLAATMLFLLPEKLKVLYRTL